jgi:hypothetical protein
MGLPYIAKSIAVIHVCSVKESFGFLEISILVDDTDEIVNKSKGTVSKKKQKSTKFVDTCRIHRP